MGPAFILEGDIQAYQKKERTKLSLRVPFTQAVTQKEHLFPFVDLGSEGLFRTVYSSIY